jgi:hypothetical protein
MLFKTAAEAGRFQDCLSAEGIPLGPKSACKNLMMHNPVISKKMVHGALPPFGKGFNGEFVDYVQLSGAIKADEVLARYIAISIGPQYGDGDISDIIAAIKKVDENLYADCND